MKSTFMQSKETVTRNWYVLDAKDMPLGRVASKAAVLLRGKHKVTYTPHVDCGDYVIIVNADKVALTGNKLENKIYYDHSRYVGGLRERTAKEMRQNYPVEMLERARVHRDEHTYVATNMDELQEILDTKPGFVKAMWCEDRACEDMIKEKFSATSRCMPFEQETLADTCVCCGKPAKKMVYWGRAY